MQDELLRVLKDCVEGRMSNADWQIWWNLHAAEVEAKCERMTYLRLKCRLLGEAAEQVLESYGIFAKPLTGYCRRCREPMFTAIPGTTTVEEIREFARTSKMAHREIIIREGWIHPGQYCPNGCTLILWNLKKIAPQEK